MEQEKVFLTVYKCGGCGGKYGIEADKAFCCCPYCKAKAVFP